MGGGVGWLVDVAGVGEFFLFICLGERVLD